MYKPNFCAECGERIARARHRFWASRRFCRNCARRFRKGQILLPLVAGAALFCLGLVMGRALRPPPPPLIVGHSQLSPIPAAAEQTGTPRADTGEETQAAPPSPEPSYGPDGTATERPTDPQETISICGARTQKGTPCRRRVRGTGRCWQHKGLPAIIPLKKLIVTGD